MTSAPVLVGDIGGTNARFALARQAGGRTELSHHQSFPAADYPTFLEGVRAYLDGCDVTPTSGVLAVAGPIIDGAVDLTNSPWTISQAELATVGLTATKLVNDFEALAWSLPEIPQTDLARIGGPDSGAPDATLAVLGPGTGFGISALVRDAEGRRLAMPGEGGHMGFAPTDELEDELVRRLRARHGRVSVERLICGPGLLVLHRLLADIEGRKTAIDDPAELTRRALAEPDSPCAATLTRFCAILGDIAGDIALITGARGGVLIGGGIAPRIVDFLRASPFRDRFENKGRYHAYVVAIPTQVILHKHAALLGAARVAFDDL